MSDLVNVKPSSYLLIQELLQLLVCPEVLTEVCPGSGCHVGVFCFQEGIISDWEDIKYKIEMYCKLSLRDVRAVMRLPGPSISLLSHIISCLSPLSLSLSQKNKFQTYKHGSIFFRCRPHLLVDICIFWIDKTYVLLGNKISPGHIGKDKKMRILTRGL